MLTKVSVENFKSFCDLTELSMISSSKIRKQEDHRVQIGSTKLLKHAVVYGANASGKTNLIEVFMFIKATLAEGLPVQSSKLFCRTKPENATKESQFELQFSVEGTFYAYGFSALLNAREIKSEWLYELYQNGSAKCLFERQADQPPVFYPTLTKNEKLRFKTYANDFASNKTGLFLTEMSRGKQFDADSKLAIYGKIYRWLQNNIIIYTPNSRVTDFRCYYDDSGLAEINQLIRTFDTGISDIRVESVTLEEIQKQVPEVILRDILTNMAQTVVQTGNKPVRTSMRLENNFFSIDMNERQEIHATTIKLRHEKSAFDFTFDDESDGSRRLFELIDMLLIKDNDVVFVVDELERSLHPMLTKHFLELFTKLHKDQKNQLVFTTHEAAIMDQACFRRDEFWLVERNAQNESTIYPLDRFKERYDKDLSKAYLEGRYGAVPVFSKPFASEVQ